jgi:hypothetical protein
MTYTEQDAKRWDDIIEADSEIPDWVRKSKREMLRACMWMGERLMAEKGYTVEDVKKIGKSFAFKNVFKKTDFWEAAEKTFNEIAPKKMIDKT